MNASDEPCILFFVKYPQKGQVKKRLAVELGEDVAVELYRNFAQDSLSTLERCGVQIVVCFYPPDSEYKFVKWLGTYFRYLPQRGSNLGQRMKNSFIKAFHTRFNPVFLIGSDIPDLPASVIREAFLALNTDEVVIGPSFDGGYYLIGFKNDTFLPETFDEISWGTQTVFQETIAVLQSAGYKIHLLPRWGDVDTYANLKHLIDRNQNTKFRYSKTISYLSKMAGYWGEDVS
ncbi:MAG: TIGR04282 family arsenosugar biosynthesis glycosyltransferase [Deltaproteobacteria bacterium]|nr:TIGR04282 family arsenosugar biosynthesis glycosyltransferase [Deltaproteobacteria bacterium]